MDEKNNRYEMVMTEAEKQALQRLAERDGVSMGHWVRSAIRRAAKRRDLWRK